MPSPRALRLAIDIGGTFTDTVLMDGTEVVATAKTATTPADPSQSALTGAELVLAEAGADFGDVTGMVHGTTLATNALIERRGAAVATVTTQGFRDILEIGYERRYSQYAIDLEKPDLLVPRVRAFTIGGRLNAQGRELDPLDHGAVAQLAARLRQSGAEAVAICLMHAYANPDHERRLRNLLAAEAPELNIALSHEVSPEAREFDRLCTTIANAYIQPLMAGYLARFSRCFASRGLRADILMMTAGGGMTTVETAARLPIRLVESGPAGGAILAARLAAEVGEAEVLSFDMGGTTAKLCLIDNAQPQRARNFEIARAERFIKGSGMPVRIPVIDMIEIGAGGGSMARIDGLGRLRAGPESASADPGPVAFGKGGEVPTVTDADIAQGLIPRDGFAEGRLALNPEAAVAALAAQVGAPLRLGADGAAQGLSEIVDESMASAARMHAVEAGKDLSQRVMIAFGGNGPLHATRAARRAQVSRILIPRSPGVGSALGFLFAPVSFEIVRSHYTTLARFDHAGIAALFDTMRQEAAAVVRAGAAADDLIERRLAFMRYRGQGHEIEVALPNQPIEPPDIAQLTTAFEAEYSRQFSRPVPDMEIEVLNWALTVSTPQPALEPVQSATQVHDLTAKKTQPILCDVTHEWRHAGLFQRDDLRAGDRIMGPALITEPQTTTFVSTDFDATCDQAGNLWLTRRVAR